MRRCRVHLTEVSGHWETLQEERQREEEARIRLKCRAAVSPNTLVLLGASVNVNMDSVTESFFKLLFLLSIHDWNTVVAGNKCKYCK